MSQEQNINIKADQTLNQNEEGQELDKEIIKQVENSDIPKDEQEHIIAAMSMYSGPIPHPKLLAGYEALYKGAAKKIIDNGIAESEQRRKLEEERQRRRGRLAWVSLIIAGCFVLFFTIGAVYLIMNEHPYFGGASGLISFFTFMGSISNNIDTLSGNDDLTNNKDHDNID
jgi:uncharacterized membrane protein